ncbi:MAG TPA: hypothetical protein PLE45_09620 [Spirochaetota bacterium]|nr:hypothetical protein [Spirochaetota bacterium]HOL56568.1 hypothetical protein [Spirochaetota bacterium]HPP04899.1 hypothetical protein [Spirochaetota bacterium]
MKKIVILFIVFLLFISCKKENISNNQPQKANQEILGSYYSDDNNYSLEISFGKDDYSGDNLRYQFKIKSNKGKEFYENDEDSDYLMLYSESYENASQFWDGTIFGGSANIKFENGMYIFNYEFKKEIYNESDELIDTKTTTINTTFKKK